MVAMSGAIMPAPFAMPLSVTDHAAEIGACAVATLGKVSVVMMARAASPRPSALGPDAPRHLQHAIEARGVQRLADHPRGGEEHRCRPARRTPLSARSPP